ncbi:MAG: tandem-95 repeat protein [Planctomycetes bacterium]|nr:tandem-95 repeat protein [Planctomycetota bacterium]
MPRRKHRRRDSRHSRLALEPLEDRRLLAVASFQDGVFPSADYSGTRDAPIFASDADVNFGDAVTLRADAEQSSTGEPVWSLIKWDLSSIPAGATVDEVSLSVNVTNITAAPGFHLFEVKTPWLESEVTWNGPDADGTWEDPGLGNPIDAGDVILGTLPGTALGPLTISLTVEGLDLVQRWVNDPSTNHGFLLANADNTNSERFDSREGDAPEDRPKLSIDFDFVDVDPPVATLTFPEDNGPDDRDDDLGEVRVGLRDRVEIQLSDYSLDDATVTAETVTVTRDGEPFADVAFSFDAETDLITLASAVAPFPAGDYLITLNGGDSKIADTTGNQLPRTVFTVQFDETLPTDPIARDDSYETDEDTPLIVDAESGVLANDFDGNNPQMTVILVQAPQHGTIDFREDGSFTYAPETNYFGPDEFTYQISAPLYDSSLASVALDVVSIADVPIAMDDSFAVLVGAQLDVAMPGILANDSDGDGDELTAVLLTSPENGALTLSADGSFQYMPNPLFVGVDEFSYAAADAQTQTPARVVISVHPPGSIRGTVWNDLSRDGSMDADEPGQVGWTVYFDLNRNGLLDAGEPNAISEADGSYEIVDLLPDTYALAVELQEGWERSLPAAGPGDPFHTVVVESGEEKTGFDFGTYLIAAPFAADDQYEMVEGNSLIADVTNGVLSNDLNIGAASTVMLVEPPQSGFVILSDDGTFQYSPPPRFIGTTTFRYRFGNGEVNSNTATVTIDVLPFVNSPPAVLNDSYATVENVPLVVAANDGVLANDSDADGHPLAALKVSSPANGTLTLSIDGSFSYSPRRGFSGIDSFTYRASDGLDASELATVTIEVIDAIIEPIAEDDSYEVGIGRTLEVGAAGVLLNDVDPDDDLMWASLIQRPKHGELSLGADGSFVYTPDPGFVGTDGFIYRVEDEDVGPPDYEFVSLGDVDAAIIEMAAYDGDLYFTVRSGRFFDLGSTGKELWVSDGTAAGTRLLIDLNPGPGNGASLEEIAVFNDELYFGGYDGTTGGLFKTDGTAEGTVAIVVTVSGLNGMVEFNDELYFYAWASGGNALYKTDGTTSGTVLVRAMPGEPGVTQASLRERSAIVNGELYFSGYDENFGAELWKTDGTTQGTRRVTDIYPGSRSSRPMDFFVYNDHLFFSADSGGFGVGNGRETWKTDGTTIELARNIAGDNFNGRFGEMTEYKGDLYFVASKLSGPDSGGFDLWKTDESLDGATLVADILPGIDSTAPTKLHVANDLLLFIAADSVGGGEVWRTDGTADGTRRLTHVALQDARIGIYPSFVFNDEYYFFVRPSTGSDQLWRTDGGSLRRVPGRYNYRDLFVAIDQELYIQIYDSGRNSFWRMTPTGSTVATVTIDVVSLDNNPPVAVDDDFAATEDTPLIVDIASGLLANDFDPEGDVIQVDLNEPPTHGVLVLHADGSFTYTPETDFFGADRFTYRTTDGELVSNAATVTIRVGSVNDAPIAMDDEYQMITDHQSYPIEFRGLGVNRQAGAVSSDGLTVVGRTVDGSAFRWTRPHGAGDLRGASASMKSALDVSAGGEVIVGYGNIAEKRWWNTVRWTSEDGAAHLGTLRTDPEARWDGTAFAVSDDGSSIVGYSLSDDAPSRGEAFIWTEAGGMVGLGDFPGVTRIGSRATDVTPNGLVVVGDAGTNSQAFRWTVEGGMERLGGDSPYRNRANAVSDDGGVVVGWTSTAIGTEAFRWTEETGMVRLGDLPGGDSFSIANAVSGDGSVVVGRSLPSPIMEAFIWDASRGMRPLKQVLESEYDMDLSGWILTEANAISSDGTVIVGEGINPDGKDEGWIVRLAEAPVPINSLLTDVDNGVTANDIDVDGDVKRMSLQLVAPPQHGTVIPLGSFGSFVYTPDEGFGGIDQFTYRLYDGKMFSNVATVSIDVVRLSPTALDDTYAVYEDERLDVGAGSGVLANDSDQQSESLSATLVAAPQHGTLSLDESGAFLYLPEMGFVGTDSFQYIAGDGEFSSDVTTVTITVNTPIIDIVLLAATLPTAGDVVEVLPASLEQVTAGTSYFVEIWVQDVRTAGSGVVGGSVDLRYTTTAADATGLSHGQAFSLVPSGSIDDDAGLVDDFGGGSFLANVGVAPQWARLGYVEVLATGAGQVTFSLDRGALEFSRFGEGFVDWSLVNLSDTVTLQHVGLTVPPETIRLEAVVVRSPSETDAGGEIAAVPGSVGFLHEWETFWVEAWGSTTAGSDAGIAGATFDLVYNTAVATAARIEYGPAFGASQSGVIDDAAGIVSDVGASATRGDVGDDRPVLLARVLFEPTVGDQAAVDAAGHRVGPYDLGIELTNVRTAATTTETGAAPQTELWAVIYDVDDSDAVNFGDFSFFAAAFEQTVGEAEPPLVWWADFDKSGLVDFGDFSFFTANLLADKNSGAVTFPDNYPEAWRPGAPAPGQAPAAAAAPAGDLEVQLVARLSLGADDTLAALPDSLGAVNDAQTYFVEVWIRDDAAGAPGITGGRVDLQYTTGAADVLSATSSDQYNVFVSSSVDEPVGLVRGLGGGTFDAGVASGDQWARLGYVQLTATGDGPIRFTLSPGDLQLSRFGEGNIPWDEVTLGTLSLNSTPADLTGNGFVDFQDLTILLAHWNQNVSAAEGNLIDAASTPVNFQDLTVLLAAWTGPGPAASPQAAAAEAIVQRDTATSESRVVSDVHFERLGRRDQASYRRDRRSGGLSSHDSPLRRLQAAAVDRAIGEEFAPERDMISARRSRRGG